jgi:hypothetical protein
MVLDDSLDDEEAIHVPPTPTKQVAANTKRVKLSANNSTPVAIPRVGTRASGRQIQKPSGLKNGSRRK